MDSGIESEKKKLQKKNWDIFSSGLGVLQSDGKISPKIYQKNP